MSVTPAVIFFARDRRYENHLKCYSKMHGILYKFKNQILYEDNLNFKDNLMVSAYCDCETTITNTCLMFNFDHCEMYPVSCCLIFVFHPKINIDRIVIMRSFSNFLNQLNDISYLNHEMLENVNIVTAKQLKDCGIAMSNKTKKYSISEMFSTELRFGSDCLRIGS